MGQEHLAVSTSDRVNEGFFFYKKMYGRFAPREAKKSGRDNQVTVLPRLLIKDVAVRPGFTVRL